MKRTISQVSNRSLKSSVFLHPMTTKWLHGHDKVCANIIQQKTNLKSDNILLVLFFNLKKFSFFIIF